MRLCSFLLLRFSHGNDIRARRRKMKNNLRGTLAMEVLLDVDKFYLDDAVVGLPDYWPNNARPALGNFDRLVSRLNKLPHWTVRGKQHEEKCD